MSQHMLPQPQHDSPHWSRTVSRRSRWDRWATVAVMAFLAVMVIGLLVIGGANSAPPTETSVDSIVNEPRAVLGRQVLSDGRIEEWLTDRALTVADPAAPGDELLLLLESNSLVNGYVDRPGAPGTIETALATGDRVTFVGHVEPFDRAAASEALGTVLHEQLFAGRGGEPAVLVDRLDALPAPPAG